MSNNEIKRKDNCYLNGDHTHFIFVDDGSRYRFFGKYSEFITRFETMVREEPPKVSLWQYKQAQAVLIIHIGGFPIDIEIEIRYLL